MYFIFYEYLLFSSVGLDPTRLGRIRPALHFFFYAKTFPPTPKECTLFHLITCQYDHISLWNLYQNDHAIFTDMRHIIRTRKNKIWNSKKLFSYLELKDVALAGTCCYTLVYIRVGGPYLKVTSCWSHKLSYFWPAVGLAPRSVQPHTTLQGHAYLFEIWLPYS